jgi:hypothetical protein
MIRWTSSTHTFEWMSRSQKPQFRADRGCRTQHLRLPLPDKCIGMPRAAGALRGSVLASTALSILRRAGTHIVQRFSLKCLICGHDDVLRRTPSRLFLQCDDCGRETGGWEIAGRSDPCAEHGSEIKSFTQSPKTADSLVGAVRRAVDALSASKLLRFWRDTVS